MSILSKIEALDHDKVEALAKRVVSLGKRAHPDFPDFGGKVDDILTSLQEILPDAEHLIEAIAALRKK